MCKVVEITLCSWWNRTALFILVWDFCECEVVCVPPLPLHSLFIGAFLLAEIKGINCDPSWLCCSGDISSLTLLIFVMALYDICFIKFNGQQNLKKRIEFFRRKSHGGVLRICRFWSRNRNGLYNDSEFDPHSQRNCANRKHKGWGALSEFLERYVG